MRVEGKDSWNEAHPYEDGLDQRTSQPLNRNPPKQRDKKTEAVEAKASGGDPRPAPAEGKDGWTETHPRRMSSTHTRHNHSAGTRQGARQEDGGNHRVPKLAAATPV